MIHTYFLSLGILIGIVFWGNFNIHPNAMETTNESFGIIKGKVVDLDGFALQGVSIKIKNDKEVFDVQTDYQGIFTLKVPSGSYTVEAWKPSFYKLRRSEFQVDPNSEVYFDLTLIFYELTEFRRTSPSGELLRTCICTDPVNIREMKTDVLLKKPSSILIQYGISIEMENIIRFEPIGVSFGDCERVEKDLMSSKPTNDKIIQITTTYNEKTIYSNTAMFDKTKRIILLEGGVIVQTGREKRKARRVIIDLNSDKDNNNYFKVEL